MQDRLQAAIDNNVGFYRTVLAAHGIDFHVEDGLAYTFERPPTYYSNAVTRSRSWTPDEVFAGLERRAEEEGWEDWSIKDSHAALDLSGRGFERLFSAEWLHLDPAAFRPTGKGRLRVEVIRTEQALSEWLKGWDADPELGARIFRPSLLRDPDFHFVAGYAGAEIMAGCVINKTGAVVGISNCFSRGSAVSSWTDIVEAVIRELGAMPLVGYARGETANSLKGVGFLSVGDLQVWRHTTE